ncbi:glycosyltransferase involved in cell wall biosynthesis [Pontibacter aydingkolensis]|uniref:Glycosyltransferase n=1 Tax=Pontibacter aydingkolensis TaxID=1911536 RepID=A0ABS7CU73_9BACT|nr:glycosyltransferase [Pontibacter aydingkolensis]MBW7467377.1 glycosyltransferase [Pontibacter aydingkolensis]
MSEKRILIASLLKPVNDTRMYEKLGLSLSKLPDTEVHICGFAAPLPLSAPGNVIFHPLFNFKRLGLGRLTAQLAYYRLLQSLKPDLIIAGTHELLLPSYFYCRMYKAKLVYDVRENYALNLRKQNNYNAVLKRLLALGVERIEKLVAPAVAHFILAEKCYTSELSFHQKRYTILENKYKKQQHYSTPKTPVNLEGQPLRLLYSGTISQEYGIFDAIKLAARLHAHEPLTTLTIIGYCAHNETWQKVQQLIKGKKYITVIGGHQLVPHTEIIAQMAHCNIGLLPYQPNESTFSCIPTKLYEYMAHGLVILITQNPIWQAIVQQHQAGVCINFSGVHVEELVGQVKHQPFYTFGVPAGIFWEEEETKLLRIVQDTLS